VTDPLTFLSIDIGMNPNIGTILGVLITWHGFFTAVGIIAGVWLASRVASSPRVNIDPDTTYTLAMIIVFSGIVGARLLYVIENYGDAGSGVQNFGDIFRLNEGGISIYGAILGGAIGGWIYGLRNHLPARAGADAAAFGMLLGLAVGRIGDLINGEHISKVSDLPWAVTYSHPESPSFGRLAQHPATTYELLGDLVILGILAFLWRRADLKPGVIFALAFLLYAIMRFAVSYLRIDSEEPLIGLTTPQLVSVIVIPIAALLAVVFSRREAEPASERRDTSRPHGSRAERRRRARAGSNRGESAN
jgi:phosphatidylglycerol:prolipoprotein diacylglycerol transferase